MLHPCPLLLTAAVVDVHALQVTVFPHWHISEIGQLIANCDATRLEQYELGCFVGEKPMSGFYAMIFAAAFCGSVEMAGFDPWTESMRNRSVRYHYFDDEEPRPGAHSFDATYYMYQLLEQASDLNISILELGGGQS